jgi:hypothetical protein
LRAGEDVVAGFLVHRQRFAGNRGLVERALAGDNHAVRGRVIARPDADDISYDEFTGWHFFLRLVRRVRPNPARFVGVSLNSSSFPTAGFKMQVTDLRRKSMFMPVWLMLRSLPREENETL